MKRVTRGTIMGMFGKLRTVAAAALFAFGATGAAMAVTLVTPINAPYTLVPGGPTSGNDCSGVFGQGFANCKYKGSPVIAKFNTDGTGWELNTGVFPGISSSMFTLTGTSGNAGTWSYNGTTGVAITAFVLKAGNEFAIFEMNTPGTSFTDIDWSTALGELTNPRGEGRDLSHITFYDTADMAPIPVPAAGLLLVSAVGGMAVLRRRKQA
jgi:hypothetical protein